LASNVTLYWGHCKASWNLLSEIIFPLQESWRWVTRESDLEQLDKYGVSRPSFATAIRSSGAYKLCQQRFQRSQNFPAEPTSLDSLFVLLQTYRIAKCSDVRDKIFGMHSFASQCCRDAVPVE